jgi:hypothetical protein
MIRARLIFGIWFLLAFAGVPSASANATLLLEEPYGHLGAFTGTGHAAVYLSNVCADSPVVLRRCRAGESGVVISRYHNVSHYDWVAIPLTPYLYAVEDPDDVPLFADPKVVAFLRNQYRKEHLEAIASDGNDGEAPSGNWTELVGAAYDRRIYGYSVETSEQQDQELIRRLNAKPNHPQYRTLSRNCADFARDVMNFYHPRALRRSFIADAGIMTPKHIAKSLVKFSERNPEVEFSAFIIPQVPGTVPRSTPVRGIAESLLKTKKYMVPLAILHPIAAGLLAAAYVGGGRFDPARNAMIMDAHRELQPPLTSSEQRSYREQLRQLTAESARQQKLLPKEMRFGKFQAGAEPALDGSGRPILQARTDSGLVDVGISRANILNPEMPRFLAQGLLTVRLKEELKRNAPETDVALDWEMLRRVVPLRGDLN